jgi:hypothetical protein
MSSWLRDLTSTFGLPTGGLTFALALYYMSIQAEKEARREALADIAAVLKNSSWRNGIQPNRIINDLFNATFGDTQFSMRCVQRSVIASLCAIFCIVVIAHLLGADIIYQPILYFIFGIHHESRLDVPRILLFQIITLSLLPDYISIYKARVIIALINNTSSIIKIISFVGLDIILSLIISSGAMLLAYTNFIFEPTMPSPYALWKESIIDLFYAILGRATEVTTWEVFVLSTLLTSAWTCLMLVSSMLVKTLLPLEWIRRFTSWFFDVDRHPIRAIAIVGGGLVWVGSVIAALV